ncbi:MAG: cytochrome c peroxidase [Gemmatimonadaceae bacterium]
MTNRLGVLVLLVLATACDRLRPTEPLEQAGLDSQLRQTLGVWGALPIRQVPPQNPALVDLGQSLFFDKVLSGNRDMACATCHDPLSQALDGLTLSVGTGGTGLGSSRTLGAGRQFVPRNAPSLMNQGLGFFYMLWDGRINDEFGGGSTKAPAGVVLPPGLTNLLAAQAMLPVLNRVEMRGNAGDTDVFGNQNELANIPDANPPDVWRATMTRLLSIQAYVAKFNAAYPGQGTANLGFQHAANALAAFQIHSFTRINSPFDRYLAHDNSALTTEQKRGALLFFGRARCSTCHTGALLGGTNFANIGIPQVGPGVGAAAPLDIGRAEHISPQMGGSFYRFSFRVPALRNVELTAPYMHNGVYPTLEAVVRHYTNADSALRNYDVTQLPVALRATYRNDAATFQDLLTNLDFRLKFREIELSATDQQEIVAFLKSLTDPDARNMAGAVPASVPSGLAIRN